MGNDSDSDEIKFLKALFGEDFEIGNSSAASNTEDDDKSLPGTPSVWDEMINITEIQSVRERLIQHLSVLVDTDECQGILKDIAAKVECLEIDDGRLVISVRTNSGDLAKLVCSPPEPEISGDLPQAYKDILALHGGYSFPGFGSEAFNSNLGVTAPVFINGGEVVTMFEPATSEEEELIVVIDTHQDWFVIDPSVAQTIDKPAVSFLSYSSGKRKNLSRDFSIGGHYLRLIALTILGKEDSRLKALAFL